MKSSPRRVPLLPVAGLCALATLLAPGCSGTDRDRGDERSPEFSRDIEPLFARRCFECHGAENREADLDLRTIAAILRGGESGPAVVAGRPEESILLDMVHDEHMPPEGEMLSPQEVETVRAWIAAGARE